MYVYPYSFSKWDEYHIHQTPDVMSVPITADPSFVDHCCMWGNPKGPGPMFYISFYTFPNTRMLTSAAAVNHNGKQYQIRCAKQFSGDPSVLEVGPTSQTIDEPLVQRSTRLEPNPHIPVSFDITARGAYPIVDMGMEHGLLPERAGHGTHWFSQLMTFEGEIVVEGERFDASGYVGQRDRGWGSFAPEDPSSRAEFGFWLYLHFESFGVELYYAERADTTPVTVFGGLVFKDGTRKIVRYVDHDVAFEKGTRLYSRYDLVLETENGDRHRLSCRPLGDWNSYAGWGIDAPRDDEGRMIGPGKAGMFASGNRGRGGEPIIEAEILDRTDPVFLEKVAARNSRETPVVAEFDGEIGYGVLEDSVGRRSQYGWML